MTKYYDFYCTLKKYLTKNGAIKGKYDNKKVTVISMWEDEDSCSPTTNYRIRYLKKNNKSYLGSLNEFFPDKKELIAAGLLNK